MLIMDKATGLALVCRGSGFVQPLGQPDGGEQRCANRAQVQWPPLVTLGDVPASRDIAPDE